MFINFSNHTSEKWNEEQLQAARVYGEIVDISFPQVPAEATSHEVTLMSQHSAQQIIDMKPDCVLCQGEFCLAYEVIRLLKATGIKVVAACSERDTVEIYGGSTVRKVSNFKFKQFREY